MLLQWRIFSRSLDIFKIYLGKLFSFLKSGEQTYLKLFSCTPLAYANTWQLHLHSMDQQDLGRLIIVAKMIRKCWTNLNHIAKLVTRVSWHKYQKKITIKRCPCLINHVQANSSRDFVNVWMVNFVHEPNAGRLERIMFR